MKKSHVFLLGVGAVAAAGLSRGTDVTVYRETTGRISGTVRIAVLSDLHGRKLTDAEMKLLKQEEPDLILIPGDLFDFYDRRDARALELVDVLKDYPVFYATGNHELERGDEDTLKELLQEHGVHVLSDCAETVVVGDSVVEIGGYDCRWTEKYCSPRAVNQMFHTGHYRILMSHRPHWISLYNAVNCDLVISGHAHGGQWRIFGQGIYAPGQGIFPKYTAGVHEGRLVISRGLANHTFIPRIFNPPEIVLLNIIPKNRTEK